MKGESRPGTGGAAAVPRSVDGLFARATVHVRPARRAAGDANGLGAPVLLGQTPPGAGEGTERTVPLGGQRASVPSEWVGGTAVCVESGEPGPQGTAQNSWIMID